MEKAVAMMKVMSGVYLLDGPAPGFVMKVRSGTENWSVQLAE